MEKGKVVKEYKKMHEVTLIQGYKKDGGTSKASRGVTDDGKISYTVIQIGPGAFRLFVESITEKKVL